jgi:hypothetical protein
LEKTSQTVAKPKIRNIYRKKVQSIYIKPLLKPKNTCNKPYFKTAYFGENVKNFLKQKVAQNVTISLGYFIFSKRHNWHLKEAQLTKNHPVWSPWLGIRRQVPPQLGNTLKTLSSAIFNQ